jgi:hypothetical protein
MATKTQKIENAIKANKALAKKIQEVYHFSDNPIELFIEQTNRYIKAIEENRVICSIGSVSKSGMSRTVKFLACEKNSYKKSFYNYVNFYSLFKALGYTEVNGYFRINGCGMDMIFHTNYSNILNFERLGFINKQKADKLAQMTPTTI